MSFNVKYNSQDEIIEVKVLGEFDLNTMKEIIPKAADLADKHDCYLWLNDYTEAKSKFTFAQVYDLSKLINGAANTLSVMPCKIKRALVTRKDKELIEFARTVYVNQGLTLEVFETCEDARKWLLNSENPQ